MLVGLSFDVLPAKEPGINGPCSGADHGSSTAECCQDYRNPRIAAMGDSDPELNDRDQSSNNRCPKANQEEYRQTCTNDLGNHQWR